VYCERVQVYCESDSIPARTLGLKFDLFMRLSTLRDSSIARARARERSRAAVHLGYSFSKAPEDGLDVRLPARSTDNQRPEQGSKNRNWLGRQPPLLPRGEPMKLPDLCVY
jgi:hypothetical protein